MKDVLHGVLKYIDHNRYVVVAVLVAGALIGLMLGFAGCQSTTPSLSDPQVKVTRMQFDLEVLEEEKSLALQQADVERAVAALNKRIEAHNARVEAGYADLQKQDEFRAQMLEVISTVAASTATGGLNPATLIPIGIGIVGGALGIGYAADNRRKDTVIAKMKVTPATTT